MLAPHEQSQSIWGSLFDAFKRLFNMSSDPPESLSPARGDPMRASWQPTNSAHRGHITGVGAAGPIDGNMKNRHSILQNAQLEIQRVSHKKGHERNHGNQLHNKGGLNQPMGL